MKSTKLSKEKRNQLVLVILVSLVAVGALGFGLIKYQYARVARLTEMQADAAKKLAQMKDQLKHADQLEATLAASKKALAELEGGMASGDLYSWVINSVRAFKAPYKVEIPQFNAISQPADVNLLTKFPYKQATLTVGGMAHYHEFGRFLAAFENAFPHIRVVNLDLQVNPKPVAGEDEKLVFKMDIVTLVKPNPS